MKKEQIIAKILEFDAKDYKSKTYDVVTKGKWDMKKLNSCPNLTLHVIWRQLKQSQ